MATKHRTVDPDQSDAPLDDGDQSDAPLDDGDQPDTDQPDDIVETDADQPDADQPDTDRPEADRSGAADRADDGPGRFALPANADIRVAAEVHSRSLAALDSSGDVRIDCGAVEWIDGAVLQVLVALARQLGEVNRRLDLDNRTPAFDRALVVTGLDEAMG